MLVLVLVLVLVCVAIDIQWRIPLEHLAVDESSSLGSGALGEVKRATWNNSIVVAAKRLFFMSSDPAALRAMGGALDAASRETVLRDFVRECAINSAIRHPNIVMFLGVGVDRAANDEPRFLVLELMEGGSLHDEIYPSGVVPRAGAPMPLRRLATLLLHITKALVYLHSRAPPVLHLDLKPKNVLLDRAGGVAKIGDLGEAHVVQSTRRSTRGIFGIGTPVYMAPEMTFEESSKGPATDMFSLGVMATEMSSGMPPNPTPAFVRVTPTDLRVVREQERRATEIAGMQHAELRELVNHLIVDAAEQRWSALQVQAFLEALISRI